MYSSAGMVRHNKSQMSNNHRKDQYGKGGIPTRINWISESVRKDACQTNPKNPRTTVKTKEHLYIEQINTHGQDPEEEEGKGEREKRCIPSSV
jgi:hypothetical protein